MIAIDIVLYLFIAAYLDNVIPTGLSSFKGDLIFV